MSRTIKTYLFGSVIILAVLMYLSVSMGTSQGRLVWDWDWPLRLWSNPHCAADAIISALRLPRMIASLFIGAALAVSGLLLQGVTRNPLADPFLLGISGGAGLAVVIVNAIPGLIGGVGWWVVPIAAFLGAQGATLLVLSLARGVGKKTSIIGLVLGGVIVNSFCAAFITFLLTQFAPLRMKVTSLWLAGAVGYFGTNELLAAFALLAMIIVVLRLRSNSLNAFSLGEDGAALVGINAGSVLMQATWMASLLAGLAVSFGGLVGYVGLLVPHVVGFWVGRDFRHSLFFSAVVGAMLMIVGDSAARTLLAPEEIPVGVLAALIGTPLLLILLSRELRR